MLVPMRAVLEAADRYRYGQGAFNINSVSQAQAAVEVHELFRSPVILQGADLANGFMADAADFDNAPQRTSKRARAISAARSDGLRRKALSRWRCTSIMGATSKA